MILLALYCLVPYLHWSSIVTTFSSLPFFVSFLCYFFFTFFPRHHFYQVIIRATQSPAITHPPP